MATPPTAAAVQQLLQALLSPENAARAQAEAAYNALLASAGVGDVAAALLDAVATQQGGGAENTAVRSLAVVLVRRLVDGRNAAWAALPEAGKAQVRESLWRAFAAEGDGAVLKTLAHAVAKASEGWTGLLPGLVQMLGATQDVGRQAAVFFLLEQMADFSPELRAGASGGAAAVAPVFQTALAPATAALPVRVAAVKAWLALLTNLQTAHLLTMGKAATASSVQLSPGAEALKPLAPLALQSVAALLEAEGEEAAEAQDAALAALAEGVEVAPKVFQPHLEGLLQLMMQQVGSKPDAEASLRRQAVEVLLTCCAACPGSARKVAGFPEAFLTLCMTLCAEAPGDEAGALREWAGKMDLTPSGEGPEDGDDAEEGCTAVAEAAIYRLMGALGGKAMLPLAMKLVPQWLGAPEWPRRRASLVVVAALVDYAPKQIKASFAHMFKTAVDFSQDAHPRVAAEALHLLNLLQAKFPELVAQGTTHFAAALPALGTAILNEDGSRPARLRGIAVATLSGLLANERVSQEHLSGLADPLLSALATCLQPGAVPAEVQEATLEAVAAIATVAQAEFAEKHYAGFMPGLKGILASASAHAQGNVGALRDRAIECVGVVGAAVGRQLFAADAVAVMDLLVGQLQSVQPGEVSFERMGPATGTVAQALGEGFMRYLPVLVPLLGRTTQLDVGFSMEDAADEEEDGVLASDGARQSAVLDVRGVGKKRITLNTYAVLEKAAALDTLDRYARVLGWRFAEHAEALPEVLLPLLQFQFSEAVRTSAALCLASTFDSLVEAAKRGLRPAAQCQGLLLRYLPPIADQLEVEQQHEGRCYMAQAVRDILRSCAESGGVDAATRRYNAPVIKLTSVEARALCIKVRDGMVECLARRAEVERRFEEDDQLEDDDYESLLEVVAEEAEVMSHFTDCCGYLIKAERAAFVPTMDAELLPLLQALLGLNNPTGECNKNPATLVANAICLLDDAVEYCGPAAHKYMDAFLPILAIALERSMPPTPGAKGANDEEEADEEGDLALLRQACVYGITQACKHAPECLDKALLPQGPKQLDLLPRLLRLLKHPQRNEEGQRAPTENAVSALLSICQATLAQRLQAPAQLLGPQGAKGMMPTLPELVALCLGHFPLYDDVVEARAVHWQLADLMEAALGQPHVLNALLAAEQGFKNAPLLLQAVGATVKMAQAQLDKAAAQGQEEAEEDEAVAEPATVARLAALLQRMGQGGVMPPEVWDAAYARVDEGAKAALTKTVAAN